jgi:3-phytase
MYKNILATLILAITFSGCSSHNFLKVQAKAQTDFVSTAGDVADDPAIWVNSEDSNKSLIIGTNKKGGGLEVYTLEGKRIQNLADGKLNNVDVRYAFMYKGALTDIVIASNRDDDTLAVYGVDAQKLSLYPISLNTIHTLEKSYGFCMYKNDQDIFAITNSKTGNVVMQKLTFKDNNLLSEVVGETKVPSQTEGCVVDDAEHTMYIGEENAAIWKYDIKDGLKDNGVIFDTIKNNKNIDADVEGLALYGKYLIASSQGNNSYAVYEKKDAKYVGSFVISDGIFDGTSETDGIEASNVQLGKYKKGIFVVQDGHTPKTQNFKIVDFEDIILGLKLNN